MCSFVNNLDLRKRDEAKRKAPCKFIARGFQLPRVGERPIQRMLTASKLNACE